MQEKFSAWLVPVVLCTLCGPALAADGQAETIFTNGRIHTLNPEQPEAEALAIRAGVIIAVGDTDTITATAGPQTQRIDLGGKVVLPGFHDMHVHPLFAGVRQTECKIEQGSTLEQIQHEVQACIDRTDTGGWITGGQWDAHAIGQIPDRSMLDTISPKNPVLLSDTSGHSAWANSKALAIAGVTADTPDPEGGIIERDSGGEPTGILREAAIMLVRMHVPPHSYEALRAALEWSMNQMLSHGITSFTEASTGFVAGMTREVKLYADMADAGMVKQRVRLCLNWEPGNAELEAVIADRNLYARTNVATDCIKIFLDGVPTDSHTAAMLDPYARPMEGRSDDASRYGMLLVDQDVLNEAVTRFDRMGLTVKFHAAGDAAVRAGLNAFDAARTANGFSGQLHDVGHCTFVSREDLPRARALGVTFEVSPYLWSPSPINDDISKEVGDERTRRVWPVREMIEAGALVVPGSDWAVVPSVNPWIAVEALVTREEPGGSAKHFGKEQAVSLDQAIRLFTVNAAKHLGMADKVGRIEPGLLADLIVLDRDPYSIPVTELHQVRVEQTIINGTPVYQAK
ncbi:MAG: amidohydrolase family protein [Gammaproteobacteria bacterium]|nr:amidohydrolase family protein [Gammaproteobacteria bacterium]